MTYPITMCMILSATDDIGYWCTFLESILLTLTEKMEDTNYYTYYLTYYVK